MLTIAWTQGHQTETQIPAYYKYLKIPKNAHTPFQQNLESFIIAANYGTKLMVNPLASDSLNWSIKFDEYRTPSLGR